jgi:hypothetical protein
MRVRTVARRHERHGISLDAPEEPAGATNAAAFVTSPESPVGQLAGR